MHIGKQSDSCCSLKVRDLKLKNTKETKYLGDWLTPSPNNDVNIERRSNKGIGTVSQILSLLRQVTLGFYHMEIALLFRDTMLLSQLLFNSEIWINVTKKQIAKLTSSDELYFFNIFSLPWTVAKESL